MGKSLSSTMHLRMTVHQEPVEKQKLPTLYFLSFLQFFCTFVLSFIIIKSTLEILSADLANISSVLLLCLAGSVVFTVVFTLKQFLPYSLIAVLFLSGITIYERKENLIPGIKTLLIYAIQKINLYYNSSIPFISVEDINEPANNLAILLGIAAFVLTFMISFSLVWLKRSGFPIFLFLSVLISGLLVGKLPNNSSIYLGIGFLYMSSALTRSKKYRKLPVSNGTIYTGILTFFAVIVCFSVGLFGARWTQEPILSFHDALYNTRKNFEESFTLGGWYYDIFLSGSIPFLSGSQGTLSNSLVSYANIDILEITLNNMPTNSFYIKGFAGSDYLGDSWSPVSDQNLLEGMSEFTTLPDKTLKNQILNLGFQNAKTRFGNDIIGETRIQVDYLRKSNRFIYIPYFCSIDINYELAGDGYVKAPLKDTTSFSGYPFKREEMLIVLYKFYNQDNQNVPDIIAVGNLLNNTENVYSANSQTNVDTNNLLKRRIPEFQYKADIKLEDAYSQYVKKEYTKLPEKGLDRLKELCVVNDSNNFAKDLAFITSYLKENTKYNTSLPSLPSGEDFIEYFLFEQKEGFCTHYASAATLMFRILGYPARFATGYTVPSSSFQKVKTSEFTALVEDNQAHAWTEVYIDGKGWYPIEVTPGYGGPIDNHNFADADMIQRDLQDAFINDNMTTPKEETFDPNRTPNHPIGGNSEINASELEPTYMEQFVLFLKAFSKIIFCFAFLIGIFVIRRIIIVYKRKKSFCQPDINAAAKRLSYETYQVITVLKLRNKNFRTDDEYAERIQVKFDFLNTDEFIRFVQIARKSIYSNLPLATEELHEMKLTYKKFIKRLKQEDNRWRRLYWKFILCLE